MALTLPVEELTRLQITFKLSLPDDLLTFEMLSNYNTSTPSPTTHSGYKLHLKGSREGSGLCLKVWAQYEGISPPPKCTMYDMVGSGGCSELNSPQSTDGLPDTSPELENRLNLSASASNDPYVKPVGDEIWYGYPESDGMMQLSDALTCMESVDDTVDNSWFKTNTLFLENMNAAGPTTPQIDAHFGKQVPNDYRDSQAVSYTTLPLGTDPFPECDGMSCCSPPMGPEQRTIPVSIKTFVDALSSPSSDDDSRRDTSPLSSPDIGARPYLCLEPSCDRRFKRDYTRKVHMLTHRQKDKKPFCCNFPGCSERFSRKHDRLRHEVGRHGLESEWSCQPCRRFFSSRATMERHIFDKHEQG